METKFTCPKRKEVSILTESNIGKDFWDADETCSYCGGLNPSRFLELAALGTLVTPTDKEYKCYIEYGPHKMMKFYFPHLTLDQMREFIELYNNKTMKLKYPGYFYIMPYFVNEVKADKN
jgi:hypothetical protein